MTRPGSWGRMLLAGAVAVAVFGCTPPTGNGGGGSSDTAATSPAAASELLPAAEGRTQYPLTLRTPWGETTLEQRPERVAVVSWSHDDEFMAMLGATPITVFQGQETQEWLKDSFAHPIEFGIERTNVGEFPYEVIAKAKPDLIVITGEDLNGAYEKLSSIAPVVAAPEQDTTVTASWQERFRLLAEALDLSAKAEQAITGVEEQFAAIRAQYPQFAGRTINYIIYYGAANGLSLQNMADDSSETFFTELGFAHSPLRDTFSPGDYFSYEQIAQLEADLLLFSDNTYDLASGATEITDITGNPLYQNLAVVKENRVVLVTNTVDNFIHDGQEQPGNLPMGISFGGPLGQLWAARTVSPILAEKLGG